MARVKSSVTAKRRHKKYLSAAKGYRGGRSRLYRTAREAVERAMSYAFRDRKARKRDFRRLWIVRINAAARKSGSSYRDFMAGLKKAEVQLDRKMLAEIAVNDAPVFEKLVEVSKEASPKENAGAGGA